MKSAPSFFKRKDVAVATLTASVLAIVFWTWFLGYLFLHNTPVWKLAAFLPFVLTAFYSVALSWKRLAGHSGSDAPTCAEKTPAR